MPDRNTKPRLADGVAIAPIADGEIIVASADERLALVLNESAAILIELFTGETTLGDIAELVSDCYGLEHEQALEDVIQLVRSLDESQLLQRSS